MNQETLGIALAEILNEADIVEVKFGYEWALSQEELELQTARVKEYFPGTGWESLPIGVKIRDSEGKVLLSAYSHPKFAVPVLRYIFSQQELFFVNNTALQSKIYKRTG